MSDSRPTDHAEATRGSADWKQEADRASLLSALAGQVLEAPRIDAGLSERVFALLREHLRADVMIHLGLDRDGALRLVAGVGIPESLRGRAAACLDLGRAACASSGATAAQTALESASSFIREAAVRAHSCHSLLGRDGRVLGTFAVASTMRDAFTADEVELLRTLTHFLALAWDRHWAEEGLRRTQALADGQKEALALAMSGAGSAEVLRLLVHTARGQSEGSRAAIFLTGGERVRLRLAAAAGLSEACALAMDGSELGPHDPACAPAASAGETVIVGDVARDPWWATHPELATTHGIRACWSRPIRAPGGRVLGVLALYHAAPREPDAGELDALRTLAHAAALTLEYHQETEDRTRAQEDRAKFVSLAMNSTDFIGMCDLDGNPFFVNPAGLQAVGLDDMEAAIRAPVREFFFPEDQDFILHDFFPRVFREGRAETEVRFRHFKTGEARWMLYNVFAIHDIRGRPAGLATVSRDVTERQQAELALRRSEERLRLAQSYGGVGVWSWDVQTSALALEPEMEQLYGVAPGTFHHYADWAERVHPEDLPRLEAERDAALAERASFQVEFRIRHTSGDERWIMAKGRGEYDEAGRLLRVLGVNIDITERKRAEAALHDADRRKDEFLATLAHELRNPLAPIRTGIHILGRTGPEASRPTIAMMERQIGHLVRLVDDLLDVSRITRGKVQLQKEPLDLRCVIETAVETSRPLIDASHHSLTVSLPESPVWIVGDPIRLAQVVSNLLNNAAKYTPRGGRIAVVAERQGPEVVVRVTDTGAGIPADMLSKIFEMFTQIGHTLDQSQGGLGIGLTLVRGLVDLHGGTVEAASPGPGRGSTFTVRLPLDPTSLVPARPAATRDSPAERPRKLVLVVDDNVDAADSLALVLDSLGHTARVAYTGPTALAAAEELRPDVMLIDIGLPEMDGYEVARQVRRRPAIRATVLVAVTGWGTEDDRRRSREAGFDRHFTKPVDPDLLVRVIDETPGRARPA